MESSVTGAESWRAGICRLLLLLALPFAGCADEPARNLVFVSLDTTRSDHLSVYGFKRRTSPALERLAEQGVVFENAFAQQNRTLPSHASMFTGLYPHRHGSVSNKHYLPERQITLAETLSASGFRTAAFVSGYTLTKKRGLAQGFELYDDRLGGMSRRGEVSARAALAWLEALGPEERFFLFLHLYDAHGPYRTKPGRVPFRSKHRGPRLAHIPSYQQLKTRDGKSIEHLNDYVDRYDTLLRYQDDVLTALLAHIDFATTAVVVVADHGESLGERARPLNHGASLFEEEIRIPLLIRAPGVPARRIETTVETVDLLPTSLELLGVTAASDLPIDGRSLVSLLRKGEGAEPSVRSTFSNSVAEENRFVDRGYHLDPRRLIRAVRSDPWKLIAYPGVSQDYLELYQLRADPGELRNLAEEHPEVRDRLLAELDAWDPAHREPVPEPSLSASELKKLKALGYVE